MMRLVRGICVLSAHETTGSLARFAAVGVLNTALDFGGFALLRWGLGVPTVPANTLAYGAGIVNSFLWHRHWTFAHRPRGGVAAQFPRFAAVSVSALLLNNLLVVVLAPVFAALLSHEGYGLLAAKICATGASLCWNFALNNLWTFRKAECNRTLPSACADGGAP